MNNDKRKQRAREALSVLLDDQNRKMPWVAKHSGITLSRVKAIRYNNPFDVSEAEVEILEQLSTVKATAPILKKGDENLLAQLQERNDELSEMVKHLLQQKDKDQETINRLLAIIEQGFG